MLKITDNSWEPPPPPFPPSFSHLQKVLSAVRLASFPGPTELSVACGTEKRGEPGIFSHVSDVTTNEKLMNVGGLNDNGVLPTC